MTIDYVNLLGVVLIAVAAPMLVDLLRVPVPDAVAMILAGVAVGGSGLGLVDVDVGVELLSTLGLAYLLFVAGLEVRLDLLRGRALGAGLLAFGLSAAMALGFALAMFTFGLIVNVGVIVAVLLTTSLGIVVVVLKDAERMETTLGQVTLLGALLGDFTSVALISVIFVGDGGSLGATLAGLAAFCVVGVLLALALVRLSALARLRRAVDQRAGGASQLGVRMSFAVMVGFAALGEVFGLEAILGAFMAGVAVSAISDRAAGSGATRHKLEVVGFGLLAPIFFVTAGLRLDLGALADSVTDLLLVPVLLVAMVATRAVPTLLFASMLTRRELFVSALLLSTKLTFVVAIVQVAGANDALRPATASALITAAMLTVIALPTTAAWTLRRSSESGRPKRVVG